GGCRFEGPRSRRPLALLDSHQTGVGRGTSGCAAGTALFVLARELDARRSGIDPGAVRAVPLLALVPPRPHLAPALSGLRVEVRAALVRRADAAQVRVAAEVGRVGCRREQ